MLVLLSPSKTLDLAESQINTFTTPEFQTQTFELVEIMKKKDDR
ncbi:hypothetical protein A3SI_15568 [Nitritalea halalkaliphila LW7]|uniref:Uncharacterized protein n=1 Tax=Nitritalea halalkaliphila LW7 TaxID=1189621 RepID=I5BY98_9BACT|nr:peroxide stress protein YaaA [Nitritalea halalkaliphila]EIM74550.1 hypothetical protein A3SI_15568 [Nitritalea halalkaliphila LW7]